MAFTRKFLSAAGLNEEQIEAVMDAHTEVVAGIKTDRDALKSQVEELTALKTQNADLQKKVDALTAAGNDAAKVQKQFDEYKQQVEQQRTNAAKEAAIRAALKAGGVQRDIFIDLLMPTIKLDDAVMDGDKLTNGEAIIATAKAAYPDLFGQQGSNGVPPTKPLGSGNNTMTKEAFKALPLHEQMAFANEHPAEYAALK